MFNKMNCDKLLIIVFLFMCGVIYECEALKCYTCSATEDEADTSCADDVLSMGSSAITDCDKKYCIIVRVDYKDPMGKLQSMTRSCVDKPTYMNDVIEDETHRAYYRSCKTDLCNSGNAKGDSSGGTTGSLGDKSLIMCPGIGNDGAAVMGISFLSVLCLFTLRGVINMYRDN